MPSEENLIYFPQFKIFFIEILNNFFSKDGSLDKYIAVKELHQEPLKFKTQFDWTYQLIDALDYIHNDAKMVHRDFKTG